MVEAKALRQARALPDLGRKGWLPDERKALFKAALKLGDVPYAAVRWTYETASRLTETVHLPWAGLDWSQRAVSISRLKGSLPVALPFSVEMEELLRSFKAKGELVFTGKESCYERPSVAKKQKRPVAGEVCPGGHVGQPQVYRWFVAAGLAAGIHRGLCHPHAAKHTRLFDLGHELQKKGYGFEVILERLAMVSGHARKENLLIYLKPIEQAKGVKADLSMGLDNL